MQFEKQTDNYDGHLTASEKKKFANKFKNNKKICWKLFQSKIKIN
jgi:hypothetical protein